MAVFAYRCWVLPVWLTVKIPGKIHWFDSMSDHEFPGEQGEESRGARGNLKNTKIKAKVGIAAHHQPMEELPIAN